MSGFSRLALSALLVTTAVGVAQADSPTRRAPAASGQYYALAESRSGSVYYPAATSGVVPPSESHTVMGLRVPR